MFTRVFIVLCFLFVLSGCVYNDEPMPEIIHDYDLSNTVVQPVLVPPRPILPEATSKVPRAWIPPSSLERKWTAIIIHHSGTKEGNAAVFDRWHRQGRHWEGVGYNFVIGNGYGSNDGEVEVTFRWREQKTGAHCGGTPGNWANRDAAGICLVGDFNQTVPSRRQMQSLVKLVRFLQSRYGIPKSRIYGHRTTPGTRKTDCPGRNFSIARLKSMLD